MFSHLQLDGPEAQALYEVLRTRHPWVDPTLAVFERCASPRPPRMPQAKVAMFVSGFDNMKRLTRRVALEGARLVVSGHSTVPFTGRGEAPWREMELVVESGFTPLEVIRAATDTAAAFLYRERDLGTLQPGRLADLVVLSGDRSGRLPRFGPSSASWPAAPGLTSHDTASTRSLAELSRVVNPFCG